MNLFALLSKLRTKPLDATSPLLYVSEGYLTPQADSFVSGPDYGGAPYAAILTLENPAVLTFDNGSARFLEPVDVFFECLDPANKIYAEQLMGIVALRHNLDLIDELRPSLRLAGRYRVVSTLPAEQRSKATVYGTLSLQAF